MRFLPTASLAIACGPTPARAARVPLAPDDAARIARAVASVAARFAAAAMELPLETEPASFLVVQRREISR
jgi:hypothetical protein